MEKGTIMIESSVKNDERFMAELVQLANRFSSAIHFTFEDKIINGKSIMGMMTLMAFSGTKMELIAEGADEKEALEAITAYILKG